MAKLRFGKIVCTLAILCVASAVSSNAQTFTTVFSFDGTNGNDTYNTAALVQDTDGNLDGTTLYGGTTSQYCPLGGTASGCGTVFTIKPDGQQSTIYSFCRQAQCADGYGPNGTLVQGANGSLYGTTAFGGTSSYRRCAAYSTYGCGTVIELTLGGELKTLYSFCSQANCADGSTPTALILGPNGNFYGTTSLGGANCFTDAQGYGCGTVFEITPEGKLTTLYSFCVQTACADGAEPSALVLGANGNFYGTTPGGGHCVVAGGCGVVFEITPAGKLTTIHTFCSLAHCADGWLPMAGLVQATNGKLYGTTSNSIDLQQYNGGTVFEITPAGKLTTLYNFCSQTNCTDGETPWAALVQGSDGNLYGTTTSGGTDCENTQGCGTIFEITPAGKLTTLYSFCAQPGCTDGSYPFGSLVQGTNGIFYGATGDGVNTDGIVYSLSVGLGPFVGANPDFGGVGQVVAILGNNMTGTTSVTFNGISATFQPISSTYIRAKVPTGATTGTIKVTTSSGTLSSNVPFQVK
jgi:uncharacterized repeat protein (TIGR03803 family)